MAGVDCTLHTAVCGKFDIKGYPTLKAFVNGKAKAYEGERTQEALVSFLRAQAGIKQEL